MKNLPHHLMIMKVNLQHAEGKMGKSDGICTCYIVYIVKVICFKSSM